MSFLKHILVVAACAVAIPSTSLTQHSASAASSPVTWNHDIAPIIYHNCAVCHHPGGGGPFSLLSFRDALRWSRQIVTVTGSRYMPPWLPAPGYGDFAGARSALNGSLERTG